MKIKTESPSQRRERLNQWHPFFTLLPRFVYLNHNRYLVWLETIERCVDIYATPGTAYYRFPPEGNP